MGHPLIGITVDRPAGKSYACAIAYGRAIAQAGGVPVMLAIEMGLAAHYADLCDGLMLTGGVDPDVRLFGDKLHPQARLVAPERQAFETAMLKAFDAADKPVLGICLGMQMMALVHGGTLNQFMPETMADAQAQAHQDDAKHAIVFRVGDSATCDVTSSHRQCVAPPAPGRLRIVATAPDGVIEAIDDPRKRFYLGVQWHPERGGDGPWNQGLIKRFVEATRG